MAILRTTVVRAPLASYASKGELLDVFNSLCINSIAILEAAIAAGDLLSHDGAVTTDATDYIITITKEWKDQAAFDAYNTNPDMLAERAETDAIFDVTRS